MCIVLGILILALLAYIVYLYASYYRIEDNQELVVEAPVDDTTTGAAAVLATDTEYSAVTYNIGFGAYLPDYSFFMDGGTSSWAESPETVQYAINGAGELVKSLDPDFALIQEIDLDATRSYHTDEYEMLRNILPEYTTVFAQNYDSAFLFYPFTQPHGSSRAGLGLFSKYPVSSALRRSFPISTSFSKFFDLDRCYSVSRIPVDNGKELVIFNLHMSAYGNSDEIRKGQIEMLCNDMAKEYEAGNYVLCGGDFKDVYKRQVHGFRFHHQILIENALGEIRILPGLQQSTVQTLFIIGETESDHIARVVLVCSSQTLYACLLYTSRCV